MDSRAARGTQRQNYSDRNLASSTSGTVNHNIVLKRRDDIIGIKDQALSWFEIIFVQSP